MQAHTQVEAGPTLQVGRHALAVLMLMALLMISGCRTQLYAHLVESDANDMVSALRARNVDAAKVSDDGGKSWTVQVDEAQVLVALRLLEEQGLPRQKHASLGELFRKDSMVTSPQEDRVRLLHGMAEELSETIGHIDGVVTARVHIVLPETNPWGKASHPSSASVFIKHHALTRIDVLQPAIRHLVAGAVEGLTPERVAVTLVPAQLLTQVEARSQPSGWYGVLALGVMLLAGAGYAAWRRWRPGDALALPPLKWPSVPGSVHAGADTP